jgi:fatty-acid peroxygenase
VFETQLLLEPTVCMRGREAAQLFYDPDRFERHGALPMRMQRTLLGTGSVMVLDGDEHRHRKALLMSVMTPESIQHLVDLFAHHWRAQLSDWGARERIVLLTEAGQVLCRAVCQWVGVPLHEEDVPRRTADLHALIDAPAAVGPRYWRGLRARRRCEQWIGQLVNEVRRGIAAPGNTSPLIAVATHRDHAGKLLDSHTAAVEVLNWIRPVVAIDRFIVFLAHALHEHPEWERRFRLGDREAEEAFVHEVRRSYPFFPMTAARVRAPFDWRGIHFKEGERVLLDLYGTNHHPEEWSEPARFDPERFQGSTPGPFDLVPQGGGEHWTGHRCAGEWVTIAIMKQALQLLTGQMTYVVPPQDLSISLRRIPAILESRFTITHVAPVPAS